MPGPNFRPRFARLRLRGYIGTNTVWRYLLLLCGLLVLARKFRNHDTSGASAVQSAPVVNHVERSRNQGPNDRLQANDKRADAVREAFIHGWKGYRKYAFGHNELMPLSRSHSDTRAAWPATAIDSLSTAILMDIPDIIDDVLSHITTFDFGETEQQVSMFSSTKTFIGGMLSAYDLLIGPKAHLVHGRSRTKQLLGQAQAIADNLAFAFETGSRLPQNYLFLKPKPHHHDVMTTDITAAGTLSLEWTRLSDLSQDSRYADLVASTENAIFNAFNPGNSKCEVLFDGLYGKVIDLQSGKFQTFNGGFMSGSGSFYEYLLKMYIYAPTQYQNYRDRWLQAADSAMKHLASHPSGRPDLTFLATYNCTDRQYITDHTAFFAAGNLILGGSVLQQQKFIDFGLLLVESQVVKHQATTTGLAPDRWTWLPNYCKANAKDTRPECQLPPECSSQLKFYAKHGHCILDPTSRVRPETLESLYYAYRVTRNPKYQDMSWEIFKAINRTTRVTSGGFSGITDVNVMPKTDSNEGRIDSMFTWIMGETLKYAWMIHADDDAEWQIRADGKNRWVFNTQAHPLRIRSGSA